MFKDGGINLAESLKGIILMKEKSTVWCFMNPN